LTLSAREAATPLFDERGETVFERVEDVEGARGLEARMMGPSSGVPVGHEFVAQLAGEESRFDLAHHDVGRTCG
jgi:hypothetical protein